MAWPPADTSPEAASCPTPPILAALCAITMLPVAALTRFKLSFPVLTGLMGGGQLGGLVVMWPCVPFRGDALPVVTLVPSCSGLRLRDVLG